MDSGWAVIIGAAVAFVGSIFGSVFGPRWAANHDRAQRREESRRDAIREALLDITDGFNSMQNYRLSGGTTPSGFARTMQGIGKLGLNIHTSEAAIEQIALANLKLIQIGDHAHMSAAIGSWAQISHRWYRGEIPNSELPGEATIELKKSHAEAEELLAKRRAQAAQDLGAVD